MPRSLILAILIIVLGVLCFLTSGVQADEAGNGLPQVDGMVAPLPVQCISQTDFEKHQKPVIPIWHGVNEAETGQYVVFELVADGSWYEVLFTNSGLACVIDGGTDHRLIGDEANAS